MDDLVTWLAASLTRYEAPRLEDGPADVEMRLNAAFAADFGARMLIPELGTACQLKSSGRVTLFRDPNPTEPPPRGPGVFLVVSGQRRLLLTPTDPPVQWFD